MLAAAAAWLGRRAEKIPLNTRLALLAAGAVLAVHWVCFFLSARLSTVAIGMVASFTFPVFSAVAEPIVFRERFRPRTLLTAGLVVAGVACLLLADTARGSVLLGVAFGLAASVLFVTRNLITRGVVAKVGGIRAMAWQVGAAAIVLSWAFLLLDAPPTATDWLGVLYLGLVPTALTHTLFIRSFRYFSVATASVITSLQVLYGIAYAWMFLGERPDAPVLAGGGIVLAAVVFESLAAGRASRRPAEVADVDAA